MGSWKEFLERAKEFASRIGRHIDAADFLNEAGLKEIFDNTFKEMRGTRPMGDPAAKASVSPLFSKERTMAARNQAQGRYVDRLDRRLNQRQAVRAAGSALQPA
jgi:hypothetical protein